MSNNITQYISVFTIPFLAIVFTILFIYFLNSKKKERVNPSKELEIKKWNRKSNSIQVSFVIEVLTIIWLFVFVIVGSYIDNLINALTEPNSFVDDMVNILIKFDADMFSNLSLSLMTLVVTISTVLITFNRKYYLVFSIREVLSMYRFKEILILTVISNTAICCLMMLPLTKMINNILKFAIIDPGRSANTIIVLWFWTSFLLVAILCSLFCIVAVFYIVFSVLLSEQKVELKLLRNLHNVLGQPNLDQVLVEAAENWDTYAMAINIKYLTKNYIESCNKIKVEEVEKIEFYATAKKHKEKTYKTARKMFIRTIAVYWVILALLQCTCIWLSNVKMDLRIILASVLSILVTGAVLIVPALRRNPSERYKENMIKLNFNAWGCFLQKENRVGIMFPLRKNLSIFATKNQKFIWRLNSLVAFFYIALSKDIESNKIEQSLKLVIDSIHVGQKEDNSNMVSLLPVFSIGYFAFAKGHKIETVKDEYRKLNLNHEQRHNFNVMLQTHIRSLKSMEEMESVNTFLQWMQNTVETRKGFNKKDCQLIKGALFLKRKILGFLNRIF